MSTYSPHPYATAAPAGPVEELSSCPPNATPPPSYAHSTAPNRAPSNNASLPPYLTLAPRISLSVLAPTLIAVIIVAFSLASGSAAVDAAAEASKATLQSACGSVQSLARQVLESPDAVKQAVIRSVQKSVDGTVGGTQRLILIILTVTPKIIMFFIDMFRSLLLCLIQLIVQGALAAVLALVTEANDAIESMVKGIRSAVQSAFGAANTVIDGINKAISFTGQSIDDLSIPDLNSLANFTMPTGAEDTLKEIQDKMPDLDDLKDELEKLITVPFTKLEGEVNSTFASYSFNATEALSSNPNATASNLASTLDICSDLDLSLIDSLAHDIWVLARAGIIAVLVFALLICAWLVWSEWRAVKRVEDIVRSEVEVLGNDGWNGTEARFKELVTRLQHPFMFSLTDRLRSERVRNSTRWFFLYTTHPGPLGLLALGLVGLISVLAQLAALDHLRPTYTARIDSSSAAMQNSVSQSLFDSTGPQSKAFADSLNAYISRMESTMNDDVFGFVDSAVLPINDTLTSFMDGINKAVQTVFEGTFMDDAVETYVRCVLGSKIDAITSGLTWVHDNAHVNFSRVNDDILVPNNSSIGSALAPLNAALGGSNSSNGGVVGQLLDAYEKSLRSQLTMHIVFLAIYLAVVLIALFVVLWTLFIRDSALAFWQRRRLPPSARAEPFYSLPPFSSSFFFGTAASEKHMPEKTASAAVPQPPAAAAPPLFPRPDPPPLDCAPPAVSSSLLSIDNERKPRFAWASTLMGRARSVHLHKSFVPAPRNAPETSDQAFESSHRTPLAPSPSPMPRSSMLPPRVVGRLRPELPKDPSQYSSIGSNEAYRDSTAAAFQVVPPPRRPPHRSHWMDDDDNPFEDFTDARRSWRDTRDPFRDDGVPGNRRNAF